MVCCKFPRAVAVVAEGKERKKGVVKIDVGEKCGKEEEIIVVSNPSFP